MTERPQKILIVDDEPEICELCSAALAAAGVYEVRTASNAEEALRAAEQFHPTVIVTDLTMPGENGLAFSARIKAHPVLSSASVMILTGSSSIESTIAGLESGADDYVTKPFSTSEFVARVRALLRNAMLRQQLKEDHAELERLLTLQHQSFAGIVSLITHIIGLRVPNATARAHSAASFARWIGGRLELGDQAIKDLEIASLIHEVGKISLSDSLLVKKSSELTAEEREKVHQFPIFGQLLVGSIPQLERVASILRHQLENFDGTGFPDKMREEQIPLSSRILRAVNLMESITSTMDVTTDQLVEKVREAQGRALDPQIVQLLAEYLHVHENPAWREGKKAVGIEHLEQGMVLALDLCTGSGMKLLPRNSRLTESNIKRIQTLHYTDPIINEIYIYETAVPA
jgi:response regulator RpfG family c-di-GMP phosphodiesterase